MKRLISYIFRLSSILSQPHRALQTTSTNFIQLTPILCAEPLKKKKKIDPAVIKQREERKKRKLEKQIRRLEKNARQLKPIEELETPLSLLDEINIRTRYKPSLSDEELEARVLLEKAWATYKMKEKLANLQTIDRLVNSQEKALAELKFESEELYQAAIQPDLNLVPFKAIGPVATPPIENYESPDGEYIEVVPKWK